MISHKDKLPLFSIIIPIYNTEKYLEQCIESVIKQSYSQLEIILVNDGSTDNSLEICYKYKRLDKRIILINKKNGGLVSARKAGIQKASGDYIGYVDSDDWIDKEMYMQMYNKGVFYGVDMVCVGNTRDFVDGSSVIENLSLSDGIYKENEFKTMVLPNVIREDKFFEWGVSLTVWRYLFKRDLLYHNQMQVNEKIIMGEDVACCFPCYLEAQSLAIVDKSLYHYRQLPTSMKRTVGKSDSVGCKYLYFYLKERINVYFENRDVLLKKVVYITYFELFCSAYYLFLKESDDVLFPFNVKRGSKIVIFGAGIMGEQLYKYVSETGFCEIIAWLDSKSEVYAAQGKNVKNPEVLHDLNYDYVVIAVTKEKQKEEIMDQLISQGLCKDIIATIRKEKLNENKLLEALQEIE